MQNCLKLRTLAKLPIDVGNGNLPMAKKNAETFEDCKSRSVLPEMFILPDTLVLCFWCSQNHLYILRIPSISSYQLNYSKEHFFKYLSTRITPKYLTFVWSAVYIAEQQEWNPSHQMVLPPIVRNLQFLFLERKKVVNCLILINEDSYLVDFF